MSGTKHSTGSSLQTTALALATLAASPVRAYEDEGEPLYGRVECVIDGDTLRIVLSLNENGSPRIRSVRLRGVDAPSGAATSARVRLRSSWPLREVAIAGHRRPEVAGDQEVVADIRSASPRARFAIKLAKIELQGWVQAVLRGFLAFKWPLSEEGTY